MKIFTITLVLILLSLIQAKSSKFRGYVNKHRSYRVKDDAAGGDEGNKPANSGISNRN